MVQTELEHVVAALLHKRASEPAKGAGGGAGGGGGAQGGGLGAPAPGTPQQQPLSRSGSGPPASAQRGGAAAPGAPHAYAFNFGARALTPCPGFSPTLQFALV